MNDITMDAIMDRIKEICQESGFIDYELLDSIDEDAFAVTIAFYTEEDDLEKDWTEISWIQEFDTDAKGKLVKPYFEIRQGGTEKPNVSINLLTLDQMKGIMQIADTLQIDIVQQALLEARSNYKLPYNGQESDKEF